MYDIAVDTFMGTIVKRPVGGPVTYCLLSRDQKLTVGTKVTATMTAKEIKFKESVGLQKKFLLRPSVSDEKLIEDQLAFKHEIVTSAYIYKKIFVSRQDVSFPSYVSQHGPNASGQGIFTPKPVVRLYFADNVETGAMIRTIKESLSRLI
ncbi:hypothetical protein AB5N19_14384 [Seiridium cardinale]|uniref:Uncharacterized protein n=1 Tax=Seiridium cardinale TaxID=138064 RepID=A0ABR2YA65_9PEZI